MTELANDSAVAVIGMAGRFPGADGVDRLRHNLRAGVSGLRTITGDELGAAGVPQALRDHPRYVRTGGPLPTRVEEFDAAAFGFAPHEAEVLEPQHRQLLECCWEALESAGYSPLDPAGSVGVFAGCAFPDYMVDNVYHLSQDPATVPLFATGNERDSLTSLISYKLGLRGPSLTVQTFCSTSLVAVHLACQSLLTYECDLALAGGAAVPLPQPAGYRYEPGGILSPDGQVRSLDAAANGTVMGAGAGVVTLKRLTDAVADGDLVHAVILGSAVNNDGRERAGYTAPGVDGQAAVIETALAVAGVKPESVGYLECHAVGTPLGDSIELAALGRVFQTPSATPCVLSTVKPSIGHLDRASGVVGLIRAVLNLRDAVLPGTHGFHTPNPALAAAADRFTALAADEPWPAGPEPRRAGVSSFGVGGTNAHVVLEEAPPRPGRRSGRPSPGPHLLTFSAGGPDALAALTERLRDRLASAADDTTDETTDDLADVAYTLQVSRGRFASRRAVVCRDRADAVAALADPARWIDGEALRRDPPVLLVAADTVPDGWWRELAEAAHRVLPLDAGATVPPTREGALDAVTEGLGRLGVRVRADGAAACEVVVAPGEDAEGVEATAAGWLLGTLARLWQQGCAIDWPALHRGAGRRVELPTYPFQRTRHWVDPAPARAEDRTAAWKPDRLPAGEVHDLHDLDAELRAAGPWLLFAAEPRGEALADRLVLAGAEVVTVRPGDRVEADELGHFTVRAGDYPRLLRSQLVAPRTVVHAWSLTAPAGTGFARFADAQERGQRSAMELVAALLEAPFPGVELILLTGGAVAAGAAAEPERPEHAWMATLAGNLGRDHVRLACRHVDADDAAAADDVLAAMVAPYRGSVALRGPRVWLRPVDESDESDERQAEPAGRSGVEAPVANPRPGLDVPYVEPEPGIERTVAGLWAEELRLDRVGSEDNFFELGGRSMDAVRLAGRIGAALDVPLPVTALVEYPTVRLLSAAITREGTTS